MSHSDLTAATATTDDHAGVPTLLYDGRQPRNGSIRCGVCEREDHETRLRCTRCGHGLGVPLAECVCEICLRGAPP